MWQFANYVLEKAERYTWNDWALLAACCVFFTSVYWLTKQK